MSPPIGLKPQYIHDHQRLIEVTGAISRYVHANLPIPPDWTNVLDALLFSYNRHLRELEAKAMLKVCE